MKTNAWIAGICLAATPLAPLSAQEPTAKAHHAPGDPLEGFNRAMFKIFQGLDKAILRPAAMGYKHTVPKVLRSGIRHVFSNLGEPVVFLNDVLQLRPARAARTFGRFAINTTLGIGGLIDVATPENLPHRPNGFGDTMGYYGVKPGPFIFVPILGPSTLRDLIGGAGDGLVVPTVVGSPFDRTDYQIGKGIVTGLDQRAEADDELSALYRTALDPYATLRSAYLQSRDAEIQGLKAKGRNRPGDFAGPEDPMTDPDPGAAPANAPSATAAPAELDPLTDPAPPSPAPTAPQEAPAPPR
jgi:phospholipid-binding lipoprotein MlaA